MSLFLFSSKTKIAAPKDKGSLALELAAIKETSEVLFKKLEKKISVIAVLEASMDKKIATLERLIQRSESIATPGGGTDRQHEIIALRQKGLANAAIAEVLDMPQGEVDLILDLNMPKA